MAADSVADSVADSAADSAAVSVADSASDSAADSAADSVAVATRSSGLDSSRFDDAAENQNWFFLLIWGQTATDSVTSDR